jgi:hypothetical protein
LVSFVASILICSGLSTLAGEFAASGIGIAGVFRSPDVIVTAGSAIGGPLVGGVNL